MAYTHYTLRSTYDKVVQDKVVQDNYLPSNV